MLRRILILATVLGSAPAFGDLITSGYSTLIVYRDCPTTTCDSFDQTASLYYGDFSQAGPSSQIGNDSTTRPVDFQRANYDGVNYLGSGSAVAQPTGDVFAPLLKAEIATEPKSVASSQSVIVQRYVNTGSTPISVGLNTAIDWTIQNLAPPSGSLTFQVVYQVQIFETASGFIDVDLTNDLTASLGIAHLFDAPQPVSYYASSSVASVSGSDLLRFQPRILGPGEGFFVGTRLVAFGGLGTTVDAFNTMQGTFVDENGNVLDGSGAFQAVKVPEPGALSLFGAGVLALMFWGRRRAAQATC